VVKKFDEQQLQEFYSSTTSAGEGCGVMLVRPKSTRLPLVISWIVCEISEFIFGAT
jgi:hypothetical protein